MRILFVATDADIGGAEVLLETLALHRRDGDEVSLVVLLGRGSLSPRLEAAMDSVDYLDFDPGSRDLRKMARRLETVIANQSPDIVSSHMFHADIVTALSRASNAAKVTTIHTEKFGRGVHPLTRIIARAVGLLSRRFDAVIATSPGAVEFGRRLGYVHEPSFVANSVGLPPQSAFSPSSRALLSIARFHPVKGHDVLLEAFAEIAPHHPGWSLVCAGPGVSESDNAFMKVVDISGARALLDAGRVQLRGSVSELLPTMSVASALVISSRYGETAPIVGLEALAHGVPVITTDLGIAARFTERRFVVAPSSVDELASAMSEYCSLSDDDRLELSHDARRRCATDFGAQNAVDQLDLVYQQAIEHHRRRGSARRKSGRR